MEVEGKRICCSCKELGFGSQHPHSESQLSVTPVQGSDTLFWLSPILGINVAHRTFAYINKPIMFLKERKSTAGGGEGAEKRRKEIRSCTQGNRTELAAVKPQAIDGADTRTWGGWRQPLWGAQSRQQLLEDGEVRTPGQNVLCKQNSQGSSGHKHLALVEDHCCPAEMNHSRLGRKISTTFPGTGLRSPGNRA